MTSCVQVQCGTCGAVVSAKQGDACPACDCFPRFYADVTDEDGEIVRRAATACLRRPVGVEMACVGGGE